MNTFLRISPFTYLYDCINIVFQVKNETFARINGNIRRIQDSGAYFLCIVACKVGTDSSDKRLGEWKLYSLQIEKSFSLGVITVEAGCGTCYDTTTSVRIWRRRKRSTDNRYCCSSKLCNHDSPCGNLTCSANITDVNLVVIFQHLFCTLHFMLKLTGYF